MHIFRLFCGVATPVSPAANYKASVETEIAVRRYDLAEAQVDRWLSQREEHTKEEYDPSVTPSHMDNA